MDIPPVLHSEIQNVEIEMIVSEPALFTFMPENDAVYLNSEFKTAFMNGLLCPDENEIALTFSLTSDLLGDANETLYIPIKRPE